MENYFLNLLAEERIVKFEITNKGKELLLTERCDDYFSLKLTKVDAQHLINELQQLVNQLKD